MPRPHPKLPIPAWGSTPSETQFHGRTRVCTPNCTSVGSSVFVGIMVVHYNVFSHLAEDFETSLRRTRFIE